MYLVYVYKHGIVKMGTNSNENYNVHFRERERGGSNAMVYRYLGTCRYVWAPTLESSSGPFLVLT